MMRRRGITLIELLMALGIILIVLGAVSRSLAMGLTYQARLTSNRDETSARFEFEDKVRDLLSHAYLSEDATDTNSYFVLGTGSETPATGSTTPGSTPTAGSTSNPTTLGNLTFTVTGQRLSSAVLESTDDFETNNQRFGPVGGVTEVSLSMNAVGEVGQGRPGLFLRRQTPADNDLTQGGFERQLEERVTDISYEFFDGTEWITAWDTQTMTTKRLPASVRITYRFTNDTQDHIFYVTIPASDVTPDNPVTQTVSQ